EGKTKIPGIIDADEAVGECDMNYDHELVAYQARNPETCERDYSGASVYSANRTERDFSPVELERDVKMSLKKKLDELR
ncbi:MAG: hypothetical protein ACOC1P_04420, partial [Minisyncoccales bacterium]